MGEPRLYILMRTDLASMNPGKAMAQAAHAANAFTHRIERLAEAGKLPDKTIEAYAEWAASTEQGFGTTITLGCDIFDLVEDACEEARRLGMVAETVFDPSYPVRDGKTTHLIPLPTCAFVFVDVSDINLPSSMKDFGLHP